MAVADEGMTGKDTWKVPGDCQEDRAWHGDQDHLLFLDNEELEKSSTLRLRITGSYQCLLQELSLLLAKVTSATDMDEV